jgi:hypothetical protein
MRRMEFEEDHGSKTRMYNSWPEYGAGGVKACGRRHLVPHSSRRCHYGQHLFKTGREVEIMRYEL